MVNELLELPGEGMHRERRMAWKRFPSSDKAWGREKKASGKGGWKGELGEAERRAGESESESVASTTRTFLTTRRSLI